MGIAPDAGQRGDGTLMEAPTPPMQVESGMFVLLVTGMSGAGKSQALKALEDMGFEAIDNVPLSLLRTLIAGGQSEVKDSARRRIAIGVDIRTRDFGIEPFLRCCEEIAAMDRVSARILFLDCDDEELRRRYEETRHRHPLAADRPVADGIARERGLVSALRDRADIMIDTTGRGPGELKRILEGHLASQSEAELAVFVTSFAFRRGLPREADLVFDVRFLANPHYVPELRDKTGKDPAVARYIENDPAFQPFFDNLTGLLKPLLPGFRAEGKSYLTIAVGCTGGRHRSVFVAERLMVWFESIGQPVRIQHRDTGLES
jgi:RNase adapter protein RapZ